MKTFLKALKWSNGIVLLVLFLFGVVSQILDACGVPLFLKSADDLSKFVSVLLGLISAHLVISYIETFNHQEKIENDISQIIPLLEGIYVKKFNNSSDMRHHLAKKIKAADDRVWDFTWQNSVSDNDNAQKSKDATKVYADSIQSASKIVDYREIFVFTKQTIGRIKQLQRRKDENEDAYLCKYMPNDSQIPRLQYTIIDYEEVVFTSSDHLLSVKSKRLVEVLANYFESVWDNDIILKEIKGAGGWTKTATGELVCDAILEEFGSKSK